MLRTGILPKVMRRHKCPYLHNSLKQKIQTFRVWIFNYFVRLQLLHGRQLYFLLQFQYTFFKKAVGIH
jgi:hypothetical protein